jgi:adenylate cyclase
VDADATVLFCDISGFTALSEELRPRELVALLNDYFSVMSDLVFKWDGTLEKYIGDALLAVWGVPFGHDDDADRAVSAAIDMQQAMDQLNLKRVTSGLRPVFVHIGVNSGPVAAGNIGSERYLQYAAVGDATNVASRLCGRAGPRDILISERTRALLRGLKVTTEPLAPVQLKGRQEATPVHRLRWSDADASLTVTDPAGPLPPLGRAAGS